MIHGAAQTGSNFTGTPDGRKGWAEYFVDQGYAVYIVDQPARGRSALSGVARRAHALSGLTNRAAFYRAREIQSVAAGELHTQWPGDGPNKGQRGDPVFDQFYASQVQYIASNAVTQQLIATPAQRCSTRSDRPSS